MREADGVGRGCEDNEDADVVQDTIKKRKIGKRAALSRVLDKETRQLVIERDRGMCFNCGKQATQVHEIIARSHFGVKELARAYAIRNRICLCTNCHNPWAHTKLARMRWLWNLQRMYHYDYRDAPFCENISDLGRYIEGKGK